jgi:ABC-type uncharacterized transport system permease subunit
MDGVANALTSLPIIGVVFQLIGYLVQVVPDISPIIIALPAPIALGALCGIMNERSGVGLRPPTGDLGTIFKAIPNEFDGALPYVVTIVVLAAFVGRSVAPAADGQPYAKEART